MSKINFQSFSGYITLIEDFPAYPVSENTGCQKLISVQDNAGMVVNFIAGPDTYFVNHETVQVGDWITGYYDGDVPVILIYPPQYQALIIVIESPYYQVKVDYFDENLVSSDGTIKIDLASDTPILLTNSQTFTQRPARKNLIVSYGPATNSIPAQTTPYEIVVFCR